MKTILMKMMNKDCKQQSMKLKTLKNRSNYTLWTVGLRTRASVHIQVFHSTETGSKIGDCLRAPIWSNNNNKHFTCIGMNERDRKTNRLTIVVAVVAAVDAAAVAATFACGCWFRPLIWHVINPLITCIAFSCCCGR